MAVSRKKVIILHPDDLKERLKKCNIADVAQSTGLSRGAVYMILRDTIPRLDTAVKLSEYFDSIAS
jgi:DNA-binding phage protein